MAELPKTREELAQSAQQGRAAALEDINNKLEAAYSALEQYGNPQDLSDARLSEYRQIKQTITDLEKQQKSWSAKLKNPVTAAESKGYTPPATTSTAANGERGEAVGRVLDFAGLPDLTDEENKIMADAYRLMKSGMYSPELVKMQSLDARYAAYADYFKTLNNFAKQYRDLMGNFAPDMATGVEHAKGYIPKPEVSRGALDELQRRGAVQMEEPEAPSMWNAAIQMLVGMVGQAIQNVNQSELSAAESQQVSSVVSANSAAYQAAEFASFKQNRQRVLEINTQLQAKYQDDLIAAMRDYETRADAAQWNYEQQLLNAAMNEQKMYYELAGKADEFDALANKIYGDIGLSWIKDKDRLNEVNAQIKNRAREFNAQRANQIQMWAMDKIAQHQDFLNKIVQDGLQNYAKVFDKGAGWMNANDGEGMQVLGNARNSMMQLDMSTLTVDGRINNANMGELVAANRMLEERINAMPEYEEDPAGARSALMKAYTAMNQLAQRGIIIRWANMSDSTFNKLIKGGIQKSWFTQTSDIEGISREDYISEYDIVQNFGKNSPQHLAYRNRLLATPISIMVSSATNADGFQGDIKQKQFEKMSK